MNLQDTKRLINSVINNEFDHIQETREVKETVNDIEISARRKKYSDLLDKLLEVAPEHSKLIDELDTESAVYWAYMCRYYFKKGVVTGTTNLNFLENTNIMTYI